MPRRTRRRHGLQAGLTLGLALLLTTPAPVAAWQSDLAAVLQFREQNRSIITHWPSRPDRVRDEQRALRPENLTDEEVGQITRSVQAQVPGAMVNIGGATAGCNCQNGPDCSSEVWAVASRPDASHGLRLARINGEWQIGPLQAWWIDFEALARFPADGLTPDDETARARTQAWLDARAALLDAYPTCTWQLDTPPLSFAAD